MYQSQTLSSSCCARPETVVVEVSVSVAVVVLMPVASVVQMSSSLLMHFCIYDYPPDVRKHRALLLCDIGRIVVSKVNSTNG